MNPSEMPRDKDGRWIDPYDEDYDELEEEYYTSTASHSWAKEGYTYPLPNPIPRSLAEDKETVLQALSYLYTHIDESTADGANTAIIEIMNNSIDQLEKGLAYIEKASVDSYDKNMYTNLINICRKVLGQPPL